jgi:hypothetical protein
MGDLEEVPAVAVVADDIEQGSIAVLLEVAREQEPLATHGHAKDDGCVVDGPTGRGRDRGQASQWRPQHVDAGAAEGKRVALGEPLPADASPVRFGAHGEHARPVGLHAGLHDPIDAVSGHEAGQSAGVVFVGVGQDDEVDMAVPERDAFVEATDQQVGVRTSVDQHALALRRLQEDGIALADVENGDRQERAVTRHEDGAEDRDEKPARQYRHVPAMRARGSRPTIRCATQGT